MYFLKHIYICTHIIFIHYVFDMNARINKYIYIYIYIYIYMCVYAYMYIIIICIFMCILLGPTCAEDGRTSPPWVSSNEVGLSVSFGVP